MANPVNPGAALELAQSRMSLSTLAARNLATTTKSEPQMQGITSRWLLRILPWVQVNGGTYRVNRRLSYEVGDGRVTFTTAGSKVQVIPQELGELPLLRGFDDPEVLKALADRFVQQEFKPGDVIIQEGTPADSIGLIAYGKVSKIGKSKYGEEVNLGMLAEGDQFSYQVLLESQDYWEYTVKALTRCTVLTLTQQSFEEMVALSPTLNAHVEEFKARAKLPKDKQGEAAIDVAAGHHGEQQLPGTYVDYDLHPREYELSVAQTVLNVHTRVADLYNDPMNQVEQQLRLTIEALRERQEHEMINNKEFGLLHSAELKQRIQTRTGPPTPDDFDDLLATVWKDPGFFLAHPRTIAAFLQECNRRGVYPQRVQYNGHLVPAWRDIPLLPCNKIPVTEGRSSSVILFRTGEDNQGVVGLHQTGIPDEYEPSLNVRFMGINEKAVLSYLVSAYYSVAVLVPDALGILENCEIGRAQE